VHAGDLISGKYRLQRLLGAGSMGSVWAARNELTNRDFAVKFLLPELSRNDEMLNRFFLEARACGQIRHPAIVDVYDMGKAEDGSPYLVMELLEGEGFDARIARQGRIRPVDVCRYIALVARGLDEAHTRGLVHRDLKPGNIFFAIDKSGGLFPKVLDFGISKETSAQEFDFVKTSTGAVLGSPAYMSPEQASGELDVDARADIWALGVIMYEALTGRLPFDANNYNALMLCIITQRHRQVIEHDPSIPPELSALVDRTLQKERDGRIKSAGELAEHLERIYARLTVTPLTQPERPLSMPPPGDTTTPVGWFKTRSADVKTGPQPLLIAAVALAVVGLVGAGVALAGASSTSASVPPLTRFQAPVNVVVSRAQNEVARTVAEAKTDAAEQDARDARREADAARSAEPAGGGRGPRRARPNRKTSVHGGVDGPGF
jgi:serine/threonine-protein kinase